MAVIETWFEQDLQKPVKVRYIDGNLFSHNDNGNRIGVIVTNNGEAVTLTGTVSGYAVLADGTTVPCTGTRSGNKASILVPAAAYSPGSILISIFLTDGTTVTTLAALSSSVIMARTGNQIDPGSVVTDWTNTINAAMQSVETAAANLGNIIATPYANLTFPVPLGAYTIYNNGLYRCISPIASSEAWTAAHWTNVKLGDDVANLKSALQYLISDELTADYFDRGGIDGTNGGDSSYFNASRIRTRAQIYFPLGGTIYSPYYVYIWDYVTGARLTNGYVRGNNIAVPTGSIIRFSLTKNPNANTSETTESILEGLEVDRKTNIVKIDDTLTVAGECADAKAVGDAIKPLNEIDILSLTQLNGRFTPSLFEDGSINSTTGENNDFNKQSRKRSKYLMHFDVPVRIRRIALESFNPRFNALQYNSDGSFIGILGSSEYDLTIPKGTYFKLVVSLNFSANVEKTVSETLQYYTYSPIFAEASTDNNVVYLSPDGNDSNPGTESLPKKSIQSAIDNGYRKLLLAPGEYKGQKVNITGVNGLSIICNTNQTETTPFETHARRKRAKIDNSIDIEGLAEYGSIFRTGLSVENTNNYYKVFIDKTLDPVYSSSSYYGQVPTYNAILWEMTSDIKTCKLLVPKLTVSEVEATPGTFTFDGSYVYVNPYDGSIAGKTYKRLNEDADTVIGFALSSCTDIFIDGIECCFFPKCNIAASKCDNIIIHNSVFICSPYESSARFFNTNAILRSCISARAGADGYGISENGNVSLFDCSAFCNNDDGISHHFASSGVIDGGEWAYNLSGGITPAFGCNVDVKDAFCHDNVYGLHYLGDGSNKTDETMQAFDCVMIDNTYDFYVVHYNVISKGCAYKTKTVSNGTLAEYGNTIVN